MSAKNVDMVTETFTEATDEVEKASNDLAARIAFEKSKTLEGMRVLNAFVDDWSKANAEKLAHLTSQLTTPPPAPAPAPETPHTA